MGPDEVWDQIENDGNLTDEEKEELKDKYKAYLYCWIMIKEGEKEAEFLGDSLEDVLGEEFLEAYEELKEDLIDSGIDI